MTNKSSNLLTCAQCKKGVMEPVRQEEEPDYSENFQCSNCGHTTAIPSVIIISSQLLTGVIGGILTLFLFVEELATLMTAFQFDMMSDFATDLALLVVAIIFAAGFSYTVFRAIRDIRKRRQYKRYNAG